MTGLNVRCFHWSDLAGVHSAVSKFEVQRHRAALQHGSRDVSKHFARSVHLMRSVWLASVCGALFDLLILCLNCSFHFFILSSRSGAGEPALGRPAAQYASALQRRTHQAILSHGQIHARSVVANVWCAPLTSSLPLRRFLLSVVRTIICFSHHTHVSASVVVVVFRFVRMLGHAMRACY